MTSPTTQERLDLLQEKTRKWARGEDVRWKEYSYLLKKYPPKRFFRREKGDFYGIRARGISEEHKRKLSIAMKKYHRLHSRT